MSSTNKFMVKPDKSLEYSLADFQGSFFLNFITIPIQMIGLMLYYLFLVIICKI